MLIFYVTLPGDLRQVPNGDVLGILQTEGEREESRTRDKLKLLDEQSPHQKHPVEEDKAAGLVAWLLSLIHLIGCSWI